MREDEKLAHIPVVFVSAVFNSEEYVLKGIEKGAIDFIAKPINTSVLQTKVQNFIKLYENSRPWISLINRLKQSTNACMIVRENLKK